MRPSVAIVAVLVASAAAGGLVLLTADLPASETPDSSFDVTSNGTAGELVVEHAGGESVTAESLRILVYEDRPIVPDRTVHATVWGTDTGLVQPGDRLELEDSRFEPGQRVVIRWFGDAGQGTLHETALQ